MKIESQKQQDHVFFLATENIFIHVNQPFKIQQEMIESRDFIPEAFMIHQIQESKRNGIDCNSYLKIATGERLMPALGSEIWEDEELFILDSPLSVEGNGDDTDEDEWDDDEEEWDEDDEDWDEEDEEWDEEDDEWEDDDDADDDEDEEEDWEEDGEAGE